jgi:hypothetical protein
MTEHVSARIEYYGRPATHIGMSHGRAPDSALVCRVDPALPDAFEYNWRIENEDSGLTLEWERYNSVNKIGLKPGAGKFRTSVWCEVKLPVGNSGLGHVVISTQKVVIDHAPGGYEEDPNSV